MIDPLDQGTPLPRKKYVYIASSWKNVHAVEMLTDHLRKMNIEVWSFVENNHGECNNGHEPVDASGKPISFNEWAASERGEKSFDYDTRGAGIADLVIYVGPSGCDAWAEVGVAWANDVPIFGLRAKGEQIGLMRRMPDKWFDDYRDLLSAVGDALCPEKTDRVNHHKHYLTAPAGLEGFECIEFSRLMGFSAGNAFKYIWRAKNKNGVEDVDKAMWYLRNLQSGIQILGVGLKKIPETDTQTLLLSAIVLCQLPEYTNIERIDFLNHAISLATEYRSELAAR